MSINPILLQKQLRENAANLEDFAKDLKNWGEEMKRKEDSLNKIKDVLPKKKKKTISSNNLQKKSEKPQSKIGATDYRAWDKFDVEAELETLEDDINEDSELTDECNDNVYDEAVLEKEKGNKFVKIQEWSEAINCYSKAIECYSYDPIFYANRALCYLKTKKYEEAEKDCNLSLKLDQTYVKALQRRAAARIEMEKYEHAENDLLQVLQYEPKNVESKKHLEKVRARMSKIVEKIPEQRPVSKYFASRNQSKQFSQNHQSPINTMNISENQNINHKLGKDNEDNSQPISAWPMQDDIILVKPINKQPHLRSEKSLRRIEVTDIIDKKVIYDCKENEIFNKKLNEKKITGKCATHNYYSINSDDLKIIEKRYPEEENKHLQSSDKRENDNCEKQKNKQKTITNQHNSVKKDDVKIVENNHLKEEKNNSNSNLVAKHFDEKANLTWEVPKTSVQFYSYWNKIKSSEEKYRFLKSINSQELPKIFLNSLECNVFSDILEVLADTCKDNKDHVASILENLSNIKRFSTFVMFATDTDKKNLWKLFDHIKETNELDQIHFDKLIQKYEL